VPGGVGRADQKINVTRCITAAKSMKTKAKKKGNKKHNCYQYVIISVYQSYPQNVFSRNQDPKCGYLEKTLQFPQFSQLKVVTFDRCVSAMGWLPLVPLLVVEGKLPGA